MVPNLRQEGNSSGQPYKESLGMRMQDRRIKMYNQHLAWLSQWIGMNILLTDLQLYGCTLYSSAFVSIRGISVFIVHDLFHTAPEHLGTAQAPLKFSLQKQGPNRAEWLRG